MPQRTSAGLYLDVPAHGPAATGVTAARASRSSPYQPESDVGQPCPVRCGRPQITRFGAAQAARTADQVAAHSSGGRGHGRRGAGGRPLSDGLLRRATSTRLTIAAVAATAALVLFIPALVIHSAVTALPYVVLAAAALSAQNPPIEAARPDIMPPWLWVRAEGVQIFAHPGPAARAAAVRCRLRLHLRRRDWRAVVDLRGHAAAARRAGVLPLPGEAALPGRRGGRRGPDQAGRSWSIQPLEAAALTLRAKVEVRPKPLSPAGQAGDQVALRGWPAIFASTRPMAQLRVSLGARPADPPVSGEW